MKLWALILAAGAILAFAAPVAAVAAASPAGPGGSARSVNTITRNGPQTTVAFRDLLPGSSRSSGSHGHARSPTRLAATSCSTPCARAPSAGSSGSRRAGRGPGCSRRRR